jgi:hypothetical protein
MTLTPSNRFSNCFRRVTTFSFLRPCQRDATRRDTTKPPHQPRLSGRRAPRRPQTHLDELTRLDTDRERPYVRVPPLEPDPVRHGLETEDTGAR